MRLTNWVNGKDCKNKNLFKKKLWKYNFLFTRQANRQNDQKGALFVWGEKIEFCEDERSGGKGDWLLDYFHKILLFYCAQFWSTRWRRREQIQEEAKCGRRGGFWCVCCFFIWPVGGWSSASQSRLPIARRLPNINQQVEIEGPHNDLGIGGRD